MSQVIVTEDALKAKRQKSRDQEHKIERETAFARWRRNDVTKLDPITRLIGYAVVPVLGLWAILAGAMVAMLEVLTYIFRAFGRVIGGTKNLITGSGREDGKPAV